MRKLSELNPKWGGHTRPNSGEVLSFDCPVCPAAAKHRLIAALDNPTDGIPPWDHHAHYWHRVGDSFDEVTLIESARMPEEKRAASINYAGHWHGWIEHGYVIDTTEATHSAKLSDGSIAALSPRQVLQLRALGRIR